MADDGTFFERVEELRERVGDGTLTGEVEVNQHYALEQHENLEYEHPRGGHAKYLSGELLKYYEFYLMALSASVLRGSLVTAMIGNMEHLSSLLDPAAPIDEDPNPIRLRRSGNPKVFDGKEEVYNRPPVDPREPYLSPDDELRAILSEQKYDPSF